MISRIWLINVLLSLFVAFFGLRAYCVWFQEQPNETNQQPFRALQQPGIFLGKRQIIPETDYAVVITQNLFSSNRTEDLPKKQKPDDPKKNLTSAEEKKLDDILNKIILYGLVITDDSAKALVSDVEFKTVRRSGRTIRNHIKIKAAKWIKAGDSLGDFKVSEIKRDRVVLMSGNETYDLLLYDKNKLKAHAPLNQKGGPIVVGSAVTKSVTPEKPGTKKALIPGKKPSAAPQPQFRKKSSFDKTGLNKKAR